MTIDTHAEISTYHNQWLISILTMNSLVFPQIGQDIDDKVQFWLKHRVCYPLLQSTV